MQAARTDDGVTPLGWRQALLSGRGAMVVAAIGAVMFFMWNMARFFPNQDGHLGEDYGLFLPWLLAGWFWETTNGPLLPPTFLPSFCAGVPFLFNPQSMYYSLPQWLLLAMPPVRSVLLAWEAFGLAGGAGMYAMLRRVFQTSVPAALLGAAIFLLNGFYATRMIVGHATYHGVMLLPAIVLVMVPAGARSGGRWQVRAGNAARAALTGLLLAYLFYSGGTNIILPMLLALAILALMLRYVGRLHPDTLPIAASGVLLGLALSAYKLLPALAFASHVVRPVALRMSGDLVSLVGSVVVSLFVQQVLSYLPAGRLVLDRVELEYGVGVVPLLVLLGAAVAGARRGGLKRDAARSRWRLMAGMAVLLTIPILVNYDGLGLRWLILHLPVVRSMSVMLRFWFAYIPPLCVLTALALDHLVALPAWRMGLSAAAIVLTVAQSAATDMTYYTEQSYDPGPIMVAYGKVRTGSAVPAISRVADPWLGRIDTEGSSRNDAFVDGISDFPCYEPMFGYRMQVFPLGHLEPGPVLLSHDGGLNLKNPACYVFPAANGCVPGDEFTTAQRVEAAAFVAYRPYRYAWPVWEYAAAALSLGALALCSGVLVMAGLYFAASALMRRRAATAGR